MRFLIGISEVVVGLREALSNEDYHWHWPCGGYSFLLHVYFMYWNMWRMSLHTLCWLLFLFQVSQLCNEAALALEKSALAQGWLWSRLCWCEAALVSGGLQPRSEVFAPLVLAWWLSPCGHAFLHAFAR